MNELVNIQQYGNELRIAVRIPSLTYLNNIMRCNCFPELWDLYQHAHSPAKEFTESYSALSKFRRYHHAGKKFWNVIHIGDGAHARTGAMFAFMTKNTYNMSLDPVTNETVLTRWKERFSVKRCVWEKTRAEDYVGDWIGGTPLFVTFVHAHVDTDNILTLMPSWKAAFVLACCKPSTQLSKKFRVVEEGQDWNVLSPQRRYQVLINEPAL